MNLKSNNKISVSPAREGLKIPVLLDFSYSHSVLYSTILASAAPLAQADVVKMTGSPVSVINQDSSIGVPWDITGSLTNVTQFRDCSVDASKFNLFNDENSFLNFLMDTIPQGNLIPVTNAMTVGPTDNFGELSDCVNNYLRDGDPSYKDFDTFNSFPVSSNFGGIMGFRFDNNGTDNYGIARFSVTNCDGSNPSTCTFTISEWAYEDSGAAISGAALNPPPTPVPTSSLASLSLMSLALGAVGLRRRRLDAASKSASSH